MAIATLTRQQALGWRLRRQHLVAGAASAVEVVRTLGAVSVFASDPDLSVRRRLADPGTPGEVQRALADGRLVRTFSFRGSVQVMAPETAGAYLAVRSAGRQWALRSWVEHYRLEPDDWPDLRALVREAVAAGPVPPQAIADAVAGTRFDHLASELAEPNITLIKPLCWQGDVVLGPDLSTALMLQSPDAAPAWGGIPPLDEAGPRTVLEYVDAYGPCTPDHLDLLARRWPQRRPRPARRVVGRGAGPARGGRRRRRGPVGPRRPAARAGRRTSRDVGGPAAGQGRLGDGAGHQGPVGRAGRAPDVDDAGRRPGRGRRRRARHLARRQGCGRGGRSRRADEETAAELERLEGLLRTP